MLVWGFVVHSMRAVHAASPPELTGFDLLGTTQDPLSTEDQVASLCHLSLEERKERAISGNCAQIHTGDLGAHRFKRAQCDALCGQLHHCVIVQHGDRSGGTFAVNTGRLTVLKRVQHRRLVVYTSSSD